jgi:hypothetical protein
VLQADEESEDEMGDYNESPGKGGKKKKRLCRVRSCGKLDKGRGYCKAVSSRPRL